VNREKQLVTMPQPPATYEIDFRGWQSYGQFGNNMAIIENQETGNCHLIFTSRDQSEMESDDNNYVTGPVKKVAEFGAEIGNCQGDSAQLNKLRCKAKAKFDIIFQ
jgi:hypothetical protein